MERKTRKSKKRKQELKKIGVGVAQGHRLDDNGLQQYRAESWDSKLPSRNKRSQRRNAKAKLQKGDYE